MTSANRLKQWRRQKERRYDTLRVAIILATRITIGRVMKAALPMTWLNDGQRGFLIWGL
jgi:hypothetical protein